MDMIPSSPFLNRSCNKNLSLYRVKGVEASVSPPPEKPKEAKPKEAKPKEAKPKEAKPKEAKPKEAVSKTTPPITPSKQEKKPKEKKPDYTKIQQPKKPEIKEPEESTVGEESKPKKDNSLPKDTSSELRIQSPDETRTPKQEETQVEDKTAAYNAVIADTDGLPNTQTSLKEVASKIGDRVWSALPPRVQQNLATTWRYAKAVEKKVMVGFDRTRDLAVQAAKERGLPDTYAERVGRVLRAADLITAWTINAPATFALTGSVTAAKVSSWVPVASLAYLAYSTSRNPFATLRAAKAVVKRGTKHKSLTNGQPNYKELAKLLMERLSKEKDSDWYLALVSAALDETKDLYGAIKLVDSLRGLQRKSLDYLKKDHTNTAPSATPTTPKPAPKPEKPKQTEKAPEKPKEQPKPKEPKKVEPEKPKEQPKPEQKIEEPKPQEKVEPVEQPKQVEEAPTETPGQGIVVQQEQEFNQQNQNNETQPQQVMEPTPLQVPPIETPKVEWLREDEHHLTDEVKQKRRERRKDLNSKVSGWLEEAQGLNNEQKKEYGQSVNRILRNMSETALRRVQEGLRKINFYDSALSLTQEYDRRNGGPSRTTRGRLTAATWDPNTGELHLAGSTTNPGDTSPKEENTTSHVYAHEFTHAIDGPDEVYSNHPEWEKAWVEEIRKEKFDEEGRPKPKLTDYARWDAFEGFAEFGRLMFLKPELAKQLYPNCYKFWDDYIGV